MGDIMRNKKLNIIVVSVILLLCTGVFLGGSNSYKKVSDYSSAASNLYQTEEPTIAADSRKKIVIDVDTDLNVETEDNTSEEKDIIIIEEDLEGNVIVFSSDEQNETVDKEVKNDIDGNGIMDIIQVIRPYDNSLSFLRIYMNDEQIYEYKDPNLSLMGVLAFEYLDLDGDDNNEIFVVTSTNANSRPLVDIFTLKQTNDKWEPMNIPLNENGCNGFSFKITRGIDEFDFVISSDDMEQEIHFDASQFFARDNSGNDDAILAFQNNHYDEGDQVGDISAWGIWEAKSGTYKGRNCIIALQGIQGAYAYNHHLGYINIYFAYNEQGEVEILNVEHQP